MSQDPRGHTGSGPADTSLVERAEALIDEAVGQAAKGSYREAAAKAEQALAIDPENTVARGLLASYRDQVTDDEERRRRRRSIAAAAATIEEMIESERLDEASSAIDALALQFGHDAPVEELQHRVAEARADHLDFHDLDAAIDAIRRTDSPDAPPPDRALDPVAALAADIEEHLRSGRLDQASRALAELEAKPLATERAQKLRTRIEEARQVAEDHRREEEILIATAAIEDRIRRGDIDEAAQRLSELAARHGASAPVAELSERLAEARERVEREIGVTEPLAGDRTGERFETDLAASPLFKSMVDDESRTGGRGRWLAIAAAVAILAGAGAWWLLQRSDAATETGGAIVAPAGSGTDSGALEDSTAPSTSTGSVDAAPAADGAIDPSTDASPAAATTGEAAAPLDPSGPGGATATPRESPASVAPAPQVLDRAAAPPATDPVAAPPAAPADVDGAGADTPASPADPGAPPPGVDGRPVTDVTAAATDAQSPAPAPEPATEVVVEALPRSETPPPQPPVAPADPAPADPQSGDAAVPADSAAAPAEPPPAAESDAAPAAPSEPPPAALVERAAEPAAATRTAAAGPALLACGERGVVCVKALAVPTPRYPAAARARRLSANVVVMALVDERGRVIETQISSGSLAFFNEAAADAAKGATFQPATRDGVPGRSWARLTFKFDQP